MLVPELLAPLLKTIKNLSMLPSALDVLQNANAIDSLVHVLAEPSEGKLAAVRLSALLRTRGEADVCTLAGDPEPLRQRSLQPLSTEQESAGGGSDRRRHPCSPTRGPGELAAQAVRSPHPLRFCSCQQDVPKDTVSLSLSCSSRRADERLQVEARRSQLLPQPPQGSLLGQSCAGSDSLLVHHSALPSRDRL